MTKRCFRLAIFLFGFSSIMMAYQWPVEDFILIKTFGDGLEGNFSCGVFLGGGPQDVAAVEDGDVIFIQDQDEGLSDLPSGLGNFVVLEHERSLVSLYANLYSLNGELLSGGSLKGGEPLGTIANTGEPSGVAFYLEMMDREFNRIVNPLRLLPLLEDSIFPVIENVEVVMEERFFLTEEGREVSSGEGELFAILYDPSQFHPFLQPTAPYRINLFINGEEFFYQPFEVIEARQGALTLITQKDQRSFQDLYAGKNRFRMGKYAFNPGETILEVIVSDFFGNETTKTYPVRILAEP